MEEKPPAVSGERARSVLVVSTAVQTLGTTGVASFGVLGPILVAKTNLTVSDIGLLVGAANVGCLPGLVLAVRVTRVLGSRGALAASAALAAGSLAAIALLTTWFGLPGALGAVGVFGVAWGITTVSGGGLVLSSSPFRRRALWSSLNQLGLPAAGLVAGMLTPLASRWGWQSVFYSEASIYAVLAILAIALLPRGTTVSSSPRRSRSRPIAAARIGILSIGLSSAQWAFAAYFVLELTLRFDMRFERAVSVFFVAQIIGLGARPLFGMLSDRRGRPRLPLLAVITMSASLMLLVFGLLPQHTSTEVVVGVLWATSFVLIGWNGVMLVAFAEAGPAAAMHSNIAAGLTAMRFGNIGGPLVLGALLAWSGSGWGWVAIAGVLVVTATGFYFAGRND